MNKRFISIFSLSRTPLSSMSSIPLFLRGLRRIISLVFVILLNITPGAWECVGTFLRGDEAFGIVSRELRACN